MGSRKALRNRGNFKNSKTTNSWSHMEGCLVLGNNTPDSIQRHPKVLSTGALGIY